MIRGPLVCLAVVASLPSPAWAQEAFTFQPAGQLQSGVVGYVDDTVYVPGIRFPIEAAPAYANSQVWGRGGLEGPGGRQCDGENYSYPWWDNYCEPREWDMPLCPSGRGHQGQDIRPSTCEKDVHWVVAAEAGTVTNIGSFSVWVTTPNGTVHRYLHMEPSSVAVSVESEVARGQRLGRVSDAFGTTLTTIHLHYDINQNVDAIGPVYVPTYGSLIASYRALIEATPGPIVSDPIPGDRPAILDNDCACLSLIGPPATWRSVDGAGYGGGLNWTNAWVSDTPANWAEWRLSFAMAGRYRVEVYLEPAYCESQQVPYAIAHDGMISRETFDQSSGQGWVTLGEYRFAAGGGQSISVFDNTGEPSRLERSICVDALRFTRLVDGPGSEHEEVEEEEEEEEADEELPGGGEALCTCQRGASEAPRPWFAVGLALLVYLRRVRVRAGPGGGTRKMRAIASSRTRRRATR